MSLLQPSDKEALLSQGLVTLPDAEGFIKLHKRRLHKYSDAWYKDLPLSPATETPEAYYAFPETMLSRATFKFLGFNDETATQLWHGWQHTYRGGPPSLEEEDCIEEAFLRGVQEHLDYRWEKLDMWDDDDEFSFLLRGMDKWGISDELQEHFDPGRRGSRLGVDLFYSLVNTVNERFGALIEIRKESRRREKELQRGLGGISAAGVDTTASPLDPARESTFMAYKSSDTWLIYSWINYPPT